MGKFQVMQLTSWKADFLGEVDVPSEHREAIGTSRRQRFHSLAPLAAIHGLLNALVLTLAFWAEPVMPIVFVWCYTSAVLVFLRFRESSSWSKRPAPKRTSASSDTQWPAAASGAS